MFIDILLVIAGLALLVAGGEALVRGATGIALLARITPAVVGLSVVAAGTSMPELVVSLQSALEGNSGIAVGNVVGSNIFNIACILGLTALIRPLTIQGQTVRLEWPVMMLAAFQLHLLSRDGVLDRLEGAFFVAALVAFVAYVVKLARTALDAREQAELAEVVDASFGRTGATAAAFNVLAILVGVAVLAGGSTLLVRGASSLASGLGVSDAIIGVTIVAAGTSTPELVTSIVAARRGNPEVAVGNIVGSNIFNVLCIGGLVAMITPIPVPAEILARDNPVMLAVSLLLLPLMRSGMRVNRAEGAFLFAVYGVYLAYLIAGL